MIVKLGGANGSRIYTDHEGAWTAQTSNARAAGLTVDHYWFNGRNGSFEAQAAAIEHAGIGADESLWWDVEAEHTEPAWYPQEVVQAARALAALGIGYERQGVYLSSSVTKAHNWAPVVDLGLRVWVADYGVNDGTPNSKPLVGYWPACNMWQFTSVGRLPGYNGNLDLNLTGPVWTVHALQTGLNEVMGAGLIVDGIPGPATTNAVYEFQRFAGLTADGVPGRATLTDLERRLDGILEV